MKTKDLILIMAFISSSLMAESKQDLIDSNKTTDWFVLPYVFGTQSIGLSAGVGAVAKGLLQPQTTFVATAFYGIEQDVVNNGSPDTSNFSGGLLSFSNFKIPYTDRLFFSTRGMQISMPEDEFYIDGSNDSNRDDVLISTGKRKFFHTTLSYILPLGEGVANPEGLYEVKDGFAIGREKYGNHTPFVSGLTSLGLKTFYRYQDIENWDTSLPWSSFTSKPEWNTQGLRLFALHDNTDYSINPSRGYSMQIQYSKDFGTGDSFQNWDFLEFKYNKYFTLDTFSFTKQNVLALSFWTGYSFSWDNDSQILPGIDTGRTPLWEGGRLGGFNHMRAYDNNRFSDKAVLYGTAEYRAIIKYNPFKENNWMPVQVNWLQVVGFVEAGRVHDAYDPMLLKEMKYDVGISLRAMIGELPVRFDVAYGDEGTNMWVMINHPFDF